MLYSIDDCAAPTTLGFDVVLTAADGSTRRIGTYQSLKVARATAAIFGARVVNRI